MTSFHLSFNQISDLIDGDVSEEEKREFLSHISSCSICKKEYDTLSRCISLVYNIKSEQIAIPDICSSTIQLYEKRCRKRMYMKRIPAIAASCFIVFGVGFAVTQSSFNDNGSIIASNNNLSKTEKIISFIRDSDGKILKMTDNYIESQISSSKLEKIRYELGKNNLKMEIFNHPFYQISNMKGKNYSDVSVGSTAMSDVKIEKISPNEKGKVIIRVFK